MRENRSRAAACGLALLLAGAFVTAPGAGRGALPPLPSYAVATAAEEEGAMGKVTLILKKLHASQKSMEDFEQLEAAGMPRRDVDRMRRAMRQKIDQLIEEAVLLIEAI